MSTMLHSFLCFPGIADTHSIHSNFTHGGKAMLHFIVNPQSKSGMGETIWHTLQGILNDSFIKYCSHLTEYPGHATKLAADISENVSTKEAASIIVVGGDGTLDEVLNGLRLKKHIRIGYIPTGSGNDFCKGLSLISNPEKALHSILAGCEIKEMDYGIAVSMADTHRFAVSAGMGFDATVCARISASKTKPFFNRLHIGKFAYLLIGISQIFLEKQSPAVITIDDRQIINTNRLFFLSAHITPFEGGGFPFAPEAKTDDSMLSLCIFYDMSKWQCLLALLASLFRSHDQKKGVLTVNCKSVTVKTPVFRNVHTDGESFGYLSEVTFQSSPDTYTLLADIKR